MFDESYDFIVDSKMLYFILKMQNDTFDACQQN